MRMEDFTPVAEPVAYTGPVPIWFRCPICGNIFERSCLYRKHDECPTCRHDVILHLDYLGVDK